jgi:hypothetical protein
MAEQRRFELDELLNRPGTYFNPQTEVMLVVDDSPSMDSEIFNMEEFEGADWVLISDDLPVDENFQSTYHGGDGRQALSEDDVDLDEDDEEDDLKPDEDFDEEE